MDWPKLNGLRSLDEAVATHRSTGPFDPRLSWVALEVEMAVAVLLISRLPSNRAMELVYMDVAQPKRGTGVARQVLFRAFSEAACQGARNVALVVEVRNKSALRPYARWGFSEMASREAWIATPLRS